MTHPLDKNDNGLAVASLVLGICSLTGASILAGIPAIITGAMSLKHPTNRGMGIAGLIMGCLSVAFALLVLLLIILLFAVGVGFASEAEFTPDSQEPGVSIQRSI